MSWDGTERRKFPRVEFECRIFIYELSRSFQGKTINIGPGGIRMICPQVIKRGTRVSIDIITPEERKIRCKGIVVWSASRPEGNGTQTEIFDTGIQFEEIDTEDKKHIYSLLEGAGPAQK